MTLIGRCAVRPLAGVALTRAPFGAEGLGRRRAGVDAG
jgi:hypothetical protein